MLRFQLLFSFFGSAFLLFSRLFNFEHISRMSQTRHRERESECSDCLYREFVFVHASDFYELLYTIPICLCHCHTSASVTVCVHVNRQVPSFNHLCIYPFSSLPPLFSLSSLYFSRKQFMTWLHVAYPHTHSTLRKQSPFAIVLNKPYLSVHNACAAQSIIGLSMKSLQYSNSSIYRSMTRTVALEYRRRITQDII